MERETVQFTTPEGEHTLVLHAYLTGRDRRAVQRAVVATADIGIEDGEATVRRLSPDIAERVQDTLIGALILSMDGSTERIVERILDLPATAYDAIVRELDRISSSGSDSDKKK
ncbi:hypothetical protein HY492_00045 [Candidatus Woesearchaeota archaeon]|nr:hypothetical protein [Candidatus Woesearchaeota archaeon]